MLQGAVLHRLQLAHLDSVLDHRARRVPGLQVHRRLQTAPAQPRLRGAALRGVGELHAAHHVPGEEGGGPHGDRGGRVPQHDRGEVCVHAGQHVARVKAAAPGVLVFRSI